MLPAKSLSTAKLKVMTCTSLFKFGINTEYRHHLEYCGLWFIYFQEVYMMQDLPLVGSTLLKLINTTGIVTIILLLLHSSSTSLCLELMTRAKWDANNHLTHCKALSTVTVMVVMGICCLSHVTSAIVTLNVVVVVTLASLWGAERT